MSKIYSGNGKTHQVKVINNKIKQEYFLNPHLDICNHSPNGMTQDQVLKHPAKYDGFQWGYGGSGPAQLALAILEDYYGNHDYYMALKADIIAKLPMGQDFILTNEEINNWLKVNNYV